MDSKSNKIANINDLLHKNDEENDNNKSKEGKTDDGKLSGSIIDILRKNSNTSMDISLREKKPNLILAYE